MGVSQGWRMAITFCSSALSHVEGLSWTAQARPEKTANEVPINTHVQGVWPLTRVSVSSGVVF